MESSRIFFERRTERWLLSVWQCLGCAVLCCSKRLAVSVTSSLLSSVMSPSPAKSIIIVSSYQHPSRVVTIAGYCTPSVPPVPQGTTLSLHCVVADPARSKQKELAQVRRRALCSSDRHLSTSLPCIDNLALSTRLHRILHAPLLCCHHFLVAGCPPIPNHSLFASAPTSQLQLSYTHQPLPS